MTDVQPEQRLTVLKHLANGKDITVTASIVKLDQDVVRQIATSHGYPDVDKLAWAIDVVETNIEKDRGLEERPQAQGDPYDVQVTPRQNGKTHRAAPDGPTSVTHPAASQPPSTYATAVSLIAAGKKSERKQTRALASRIGLDLEKLRGWLDTEERAAREKREAAAAKTAARAEVARLERELRDARKLLGVAPDGGPTAAQIRVWARDNNVECPANGRVPAAVREAYAAAQEAA